MRINWVSPHLPFPPATSFLWLIQFSHIPGLPYILKDFNVGTASGYCSCMGKYCLKETAGLILELQDKAGFYKRIVVLQHCLWSSGFLFILPVCLKVPIWLLLTTYFWFLPDHFFVSVQIQICEPYQPTVADLHTNIFFNHTALRFTFEYSCIAINAHPKSWKPVVTF